MGSVVFVLIKRELQISITIFFVLYCTSIIFRRTDTEHMQSKVVHAA